MSTKQQIPVLAARLVEFQEEFSNLPTEDAQWAIMNGKEAAALCAQAIINRTKEAAKKADKDPGGAASILSVMISATTIPASTKEFVVKDKFKVDTKRKAKVKIYYLGTNFKVWFMEKIEGPFAGSTIYGRQLDKSSIDSLILPSLGGQEKAETTMAEIYAMMERQPNGEAGDLMNNGCANIFYVCDINGTLRTVNVYWLVNGWYVRAYWVQSPFGWPVGRMVFCRNPLVPRNI